MSKNHQFRVACIQMTTGTKISENLSTLETRFQEAKEKGADFIVTPEQSLLMAENKASLFENISYEDEDFGLRELTKTQTTTAYGTFVRIFKSQ